MLDVEGGNLHIGGCSSVTRVALVREQAHNGAWREAISGAPPSGGFYGGIGVGGYGRRRPMRRVITSYRAGTVHVPVQQVPASATDAASSLSFRGVAVALLLVAVVITLAVEYWPITLAVLGMGAVGTALVISTRRRLSRPAQPGASAQPQLAMPLPEQRAS
jgi:hypothetical protein